VTNKCSQCGLCCRLFFVNLNEKEYRSGKYKTQFEEFGLIDNFRKAAARGANILQTKEDGSCIYLEGNNCSIHKIRPQACREFFCTSKLKKFKNMIKQIGKKRVDYPMSYFVYILRTSSNTLYIGQTNNLEKRLKEHKSKSSKSAKYIRYFSGFKLAYSEKYPTRKKAMQREARLKKWPKAKKEALIASPQ